MPAGTAMLLAQAVFDPGDGVATLQGTELSKQGSHVAQGLGLLIEQFKRKPRMQSALRGWLQQAQEIECVLVEQLLAERSLDTAVGAQLDGLGQIVGEPRFGRTDERYRTQLRGVIAANRSNGLREEVLNVMRLVLTAPDGTPPGPLELIEFPPAAFEVRALSEAIAVEAVDVARFLRLAKAAGVGALFRYIVSDPAVIFAFSSTAAIEVDAAHGFSDVPRTTGGHFAGESD